MTIGCVILLSRTSYAQQRETFRDCTVQWTDSSLTLENSRIRRIFSRKDGHLLTRSLTDKSRPQTWRIDNPTPDDAYPSLTSQPGSSEIKTTPQPADNLSPAYLRVEVTANYAGMQIKKVFRLYPETPAIAMDIYFKASGTAKSGTGRSRSGVPDASVQPVKAEDMSTPNDGTKEGSQTKAPTLPTTDHLRLPGRHWRFTAVKFTDATDGNNTLVQSAEVLGYRNLATLSGNLLFADDQVRGGGFFLLKESPAPPAQVAYPGFDFQAGLEEVKVVGAGFEEKDLHPDEWTRGYGVVLGVYGAGELARLQALRHYQKQIRRHLPERDEMIVMNTWGDRNRDASVGEAFLMKELHAGARLGVTYLQIDDGWQQGISKNSASTSGRLWDEWDAASWQPNAQRFPNGLAPVVAEAKKLGIRLGLWFHPSNANSYARWETDADVVIGLYRQFGIATFKVDGIQMPDKLAEINLRKFFDKVVAATDGNVVFNVDATAGKRMGYHFMNQYGNIFLENRYTDFTNYYPYWTLRNLWMLSRYVPAENLQIEFLNKWRNAAKYPADDPYAPDKVPFDYTFAIAMMGQPLAWFEASGLPPEAFAIAPLIASYRKIQADLHTGDILPIGGEPSGHGWTGFQSIKNSNGKQEGYLLVFRELNQQSEARLDTWLPPRQNVELTSVLGQGKSFKGKTDGEGKLAFRLPETHSFALYRYVLR